jgi:hypothetical protein
MVFPLLTSRSAPGRRFGTDLIKLSPRRVSAVTFFVLVFASNRRSANYLREIPRPDWVRTGSDAIGEVRSTWQYASSVPLNPQCSMLKDIQGIYHDPAVGAIRVVLQSNHSFDDGDAPLQACRRPYLVARLSGPAVGLVEHWSYGQIDDKTTFVEGYYHVPKPGLYFLEIIFILCNTYDDNLVRQAHRYVTGDNSTEADAAFAQEREYIRQFCVVSTDNNRLTDSNTSMMVKVASRAVEEESSSSGKRSLDGRDEGELCPSQNVHGFWERNERYTQQPNETDPTLYTRYMPYKCSVFDDDDAKPDDDSAGCNRHSEPYRFRWTLGKGDSRRLVDKKYLVDKVRRKSEERRNETFCLVGDSHIYYLVMDFLPKYVVNPLRLSSIYLSSTLGGNLTFSDSADNITRADGVRQRLEVSAYGKTLEHCSFILVQIAVWDAGWLEESPTSVSLYEQNMLKTIQNLQLTYPSAALYIWSPHSMSMALTSWQDCPLGDWRHAPLIDVYKAALQRVVAATASASPANPPKYLDTSFITRPMWEYTWDYSHSSAHISDARALFISATLLDVF